jgi:hypothetical protein
MRLLNQLFGQSAHAELITPENVSKDMLKAALSAASIEVTYDKDGDLRAKDKITCFVMLSSNKDRITLFAQFGVKGGARPDQALALVNEINKNFVIVRAYYREENQSLRFQYDICLEGGITSNTFVSAFKRFCTIPMLTILKSDTHNIVE